MGDTLVPFIFKSNGTHLSNFAGDKKEWPVYMTIGNLSSKIRQTSSMHSVVMVTLLLIPIKNPIFLRSGWMSSGKQTERC